MKTLLMEAPGVLANIYTWLAKELRSIYDTLMDMAVDIGDFHHRKWTAAKIKKVQLDCHLRRSHYFGGFPRLRRHEQRVKL